MKHCASLMGIILADVLVRKRMTDAWMWVSRLGNSRWQLRCYLVGSTGAMSEAGQRLEPARAYVLACHRIEPARAYVLAWAT